MKRPSIETCMQVMVWFFIFVIGFVAGALTVLFTLTY